MSCEATTYLPLPFWYFTLITELAASNFVFLFSILRIVSFCFSAVDFVTCTGPSDMCFSSEDIFAKLSLVSFKNLSFFFLSSLENFRELIASSKAYRASLYLWIYYCKLHIGSSPLPFHHNKALPPPLQQLEHVLLLVATLHCQLHVSQGKLWTPKSL